MSYCFPIASLAPINTASGPSPNMIIDTVWTSAGVLSPVAKTNIVAATSNTSTTAWTIFENGASQVINRPSPKQKMQDRATNGR